MNGPPPLPGRAQEHQRNAIGFNGHCDCTAPAGPDDHIRPMLVELGLCQPDGRAKVVIR